MLKFLAVFASLLGASFASGISRRAPPAHRIFHSTVRQQALLTKLEGGSGVFFVDSFPGSDPLGVNDSSKAVQAAVDVALAHVGQSTFEGKADLMGATVHLGGGEYVVASSIQIKNAANLRFCCGSLRAASGFESDSHILTIKGGEDLTFDHLMLDCEHSAVGALNFDNSLRVHLSQIYVMHFPGVGIQVTGGHEVHVSHCYLGENRWGEQQQVEVVTGTAIQIDGQDHWISDTIIFSSLYGIVLNGGASIVTNTHIYDCGDAAVALPQRKMEAAIFVKGKSVRLVGNYFDYNPVVLVDPVAVHVTQSLFLGGVGVEVRSSGRNAFVSGLQITHNEFVASGTDDPRPWLPIHINETAGNFAAINETAVVDNSFPVATYGPPQGFGVTRQSTVVRRAMRKDNDTTWSFDLSDELAFPRLGVEHVTHDVVLHSGGFVQSTVRSVGPLGTVVVELDRPADATVYVTAVQAQGAIVSYHAASPSEFV